MLFRSDVAKMPGFTAYKSGVLDPALSAAQRTAGASGQLYSGGESAALTKIGQQGYYGFMTDYLNRLAQGSGATQNPATAVGMGLQAGQAGWQSLGQGVGSLAQQFAGSSGFNTAGNYNTSYAAPITDASQLPAYAEGGG